MTSIPLVARGKVDHLPKSTVPPPDVPTLTGRVAKAAVMAQKLVHEKPLRAVCFYPTEACNLRCPWCNAYGRPLKVLELERALKFFRDGRLLGLRTVNFTGGGEPTLHPDFAQMVRDAHDNGLETSLVTNGTRLDAVPIGVLGSMTWIRVSINAGPRLYRVIHGAEEYNNALWGVDRISRLAHVKKSVSVVWSRANTVDDLAELLRDLRGRGLHHVRIAPEIYAHQGVPDVDIPVAAIRGAASRLELDYRLVIEHPRFIGVPAVCYTQWHKPVVDSDGLIYPCTINRTPLCSIEELARFWAAKMDHVDTRDQCTWCHFGDVNAMLNEYAAAEKAVDLAFL